MWPITPIMFITFTRSVFLGEMRLSHLLAEMGVACGIHYPVPIHLQDAYQSLEYEMERSQSLNELRISSFRCPCSPS